MTARPGPRPLRQVALYAVVALAFALRTYHLGATALIGDEAFSSLLAREPVATIIASALRADPHPPTYYLGLKLWQAFAGDSEFAVRSLAAMAGTLLVALTYRFGAITVGGRASAVATALVAISPFLVRYSQLGRMYMPAGAGALASLVLWLTEVKRGRGPGPRYLAVSLMGLSLHYFALLTLPLQMLGTLLLARGKARAQWLAAHGLLLLLAAGWLAAAWPHLSAFRLAWLAQNEPVGELVAAFLWGRSAFSPAALIPTAVVLVLVVLSLARWRALGTSAGLPLGLLLVPLALAYGLSMLRGQPLVQAQYLTYAVPGLLLAAALGLTALPRALWLPVAALLIASALPGLSSHYREVPISTAREMQAFQRDLAPEAGQKRLVLSNQAQEDPYFHYYRPPGAEFRSAYSASEPPEAIAQRLPGLLQGYREVWLVSLGLPENESKALVERTLESTAYRVEERWYGAARALRYVRPDEPSLEPLRAAFRAPHGVLRLTGYAVLPHLTAGAVGLRLQWETEGQIAQRYKVFVHLRDGSGRTVAQGDSEPLHGWQPTDSWPRGSPVTDRHVVQVPRGTPQGPYSITVGLYDENGRLPLEGGGTEVAFGPFALSPPLADDSGR